MARQSTSDNVALSLLIYICTVNRILSAISNPTEPPPSTDSLVSQTGKNRPGSRYINDGVHLRAYYRATETEDKKVVGSSE